MCSCTIITSILTFADKTFFQNLIVVLLGIPAGLKIDRIVQDRRLEKDRRDLLPALDTALEHNEALINQLNGEFASRTPGGWMPTYSLDLSLLDSTSAQKYQIGVPLEVCRAIDTARYELSHFNEKLNLLRIVRTQQGAEGNVMATAIIESCNIHSQTVLGVLNDARRQIARIVENQ